MSRKRSKYARQHGNKPRVDPLAPFRVLSSVAAHQSTERLAVDQARDLALGYHSALAAFRTGTATEYEANTLAAAANIALLLIEGGLGDDFALAKAGQSAVLSAQSRHKRTGTWGFSGVELQAVVDLLAYHDAQLASPDCTEGLMTAAVLECKRRIRAKNVLKAGA